MQAQPWVLAVGALLLVGVLASKTSARVGVPSLLLFLVVGMVAGSEGVGGIEFDDFGQAQSFGIVALGFILFSGGLDTRFHEIRPVIRRGVAVATVGVIVTAGLLGWAASVMLDLSVEEGLLLGAIIASTDAAAVFSILRSRGVTVDKELTATLELESGSNDPAAVFLTIAAIEFISGDTELGWVLVSFMLQMGIGLVAGYVLARIMVWGINRLRLDFDGLYPVLTFAFVLITLEGVTVIGGSGFLALYVAGVTMGHHVYLHKRSLIRFHDAVAWLMQIAMFVMLGLLVFPSDLPDVAVDGLLVAGVLMFVARPVAVFLTLLPFRVPVKQVGFISWVGLRGATPIILATFPVAAGVPNSDRLFNLVFFVVLASVLAQGTTIATVARRLGLTQAPSGQRNVSFDSVITGDDGTQLHEITVHPDSPAAGHQLVDLALPAGLLVVLVRRGAESFMPQGNTELLANDEVLVAADVEHQQRILDVFSVSAIPTDEPATESLPGEERPV